MAFGKKLFVVFVVLGLVGLLPIYSRTYADLNRNWTLQDIKNIIYKAKMNRNSNWQTAYVSELDSQDNNLLPIVNAMNDYNYVYFVVRDSWNTYDIGLTNEPQHWYLYRNCPTSKNTVTSGTNVGYSITYDSGNFTYLYNDMADHTSYEHKSAYEYYGMDIENSNNNTIIYYSGYYSPSDFFNEWVWENSDFYITNNVLSNTQYVTISTIDGNITNIPILYSSNFGTLIDNDYLNYQNDNLDMYYWDNGSWVKKRLFFRIEPGLLNSNNYMVFNWNSDYNRCQLSLKDLYTFKNVLYHYDVQNAGNYQAATYFYIGDNNTTILNGTINTSNLASNYLDQFTNLDNMLNDNDNANNIINNENENNNFWKNTYDNLFAMDSGDVNDIFTTIEPYISSGDSPIGFYNILFDSLSDDPKDFVISWNNIPVRLTLFNGREVFSGDLISGNSINFSEACRENEILSIILNWVRIFNVLFFITSYLYTIYTCILVILGISLTFVDPPEPEHRQIGFINDWRDR